MIQAGLAMLLAGLLLGVGLCALIWVAGERAARRERIARARRRDHTKVPCIRTAVGVAS